MSTKAVFYQVIRVIVFWCFFHVEFGVRLAAAAEVCVAARRGNHMGFHRSKIDADIAHESCWFHSSLSIFSVQGRGAGHRAILGILASTTIGVCTGGGNGTHAGGSSHIAISDSII